jgi:SAM-dependent methyltransferase
MRRLERFEREARELRGWQLDYEPEPLEPGPPWEYEALAAESCAEAGVVLDLGTGGGEVLSRVLRGSAARAFATEWWHVNAPVAASRLHPRARVVRASSLELPFAADTFDLVLSRHEEISPAEVARVLRSGGRFLTQQVVHDVWRELREVFPDMTRFPDHYREYREGLRDAGMQVEHAREFRRSVRFWDLGHLVYHLAAAPWTIPGFSVETHLEGLEALARRDPLVLTEGFYLLQARA